MLPKYITATSSLMWRTTDRSCEMNSMAMRCLRRSSISRLRICDWMDTSSADTGSSATSRRGSRARARAIAMRWRCPPENSCGYLSASLAARPTVVSSSRTRCMRCSRVLSVQWMSSGSRTTSPIECLGLSEEKGSWKTICIQRRCSRPGCTPGAIQCTPPNSTVPLVASTRRIRVRASVDLPQPDSPTMPRVRPSCRSKLTALSALKRLLPGRS